MIITHKTLGSWVVWSIKDILAVILMLVLKASVFRIDNGIQYRNVFGSADLNGQFALLPNDKLTPFIYAGSGVIICSFGPKKG